MGTAGAKGKRDALTMVVMSKSQHRISLLRPKSQQGASPGPKTTSQLLTYSQISKSLAPTFYTPKETLYDDFGAWTSNETLSSFGATIETKHSKLNLAKSSSRRSTREESTTTPHPPSGAPRRYKSATNINHQSSSQSSETPKPLISESTVFNEKYHLDPAKKHLSFGQAVKKITTSHEFHHFDDYTNHMSHYRTTVTQRINQKFNEYHATGLQVRQRGSAFVDMHIPQYKTGSKLLEHRQQTPRTSPALLLENRRQLDLGQMEVKTIRLLSAKSSSVNVAIPQYHLERKASRCSTIRKSPVPLIGALHPSWVRASKTSSKDEPHQRTKSRQSMELRVSVIGFSNAMHETSHHLSTHQVMQLN